MTCIVWRAFEDALPAAMTQLVAWGTLQCSALLACGGVFEWEEEGILSVGGSRQSVQFSVLDARDPTDMMVSRVQGVRL